ncbi:hypothetical protein SAMN06272775_6064 [Streptomyces sp. 2323.1]|nr:hypothetical protein SAMN05428943_1020 [Streptomyces sp. 2314.4]SOE15132.1 hypothetical protein SAMN06272775_6064 [Streptomyces sp. 2323.1]
MRTGRVDASGTNPVPHHREATDREPVPQGLARSALIAALHDSYDVTLRAPAIAAPVAHPNGFVKLPLALVAEDSRRLFLHVWLAGEEDSQAHDHRWDFSSIVLRGTVNNSLLDITEADEPLVDSAPRLGTESSRSPGYRVVRYEPREGGYRFDASRRERVVVTGHRTATVCAGDTYGMSAFAFHRARALPGTMTLVARGAPVSRYARVLVRGEVSEGPRRWRQVGPSERRGYLREALDCLA